jgi:WXG100 family type VII secretion target
MADLTLDYEALEGKGQTVSSQKEQFDQLIGLVQKTIYTLEDVWSDHAARDFIDKVRGMEKTFKDFSNVLDGLSKHLTDVAQNYRDLQTNIINSQKF